MRWAIILLLSIMVIPEVSLASAAPGCQNTGQRHCFAKLAKDAFGRPLISSLPNGYGPSDWKRAYGLPGNQTARIGIVVAMGDKYLPDDLAAYDAAFSLPPFPVCTSSRQSTCLDAITQNGESGATGSDSGWATETALDVETVHGICPSCRIEVISAFSASTGDLTAAIARAKAVGASVISMSWGGSEFANEQSLDSVFSSASTFIASSGDNGYGTSWPAVAPGVIAVGGTSLTFTGAAPHEIGWSGAGSGCSKYEPKPIWQDDPGCKKRSMADISADADPATGAAIYRGTWYRVGGTSLSAPIVAGFAATHGGLTGPRIYNPNSRLRDIATGSNGTCSRLKSYFCSAGTGYDGLTGAGSLSDHFTW